MSEKFGNRKRQSGYFRSDLKTILLLVNPVNFESNLLATFRCKLVNLWKNTGNLYHFSDLKTIHLVSCRLNFKFIFTFREDKKKIRLNSTRLTRNHKNSWIIHAHVPFLIPSKDKVFYFKFRFMLLLHFKRKLEIYILSCLSLFKTKRLAINKIFNGS